jgi:hypothetical protein
VQEGWNRKSSFNYIDVLPTIQKEGGPIGTIWFGQKPTYYSQNRQMSGLSRFTLGNPLMFGDIDDVASVASLVIDLREKLSKRDTTFAQ